jgi:NADH-quinone oxidoreductase subunit G
VLKAAQALPLNLSNQTQAKVDVSRTAGTPATASIYQLDGLVRRASSLQLTADARAVEVLA